MRRRILLFLLQFIPLFALCLWAYPRVLPGYQKLVLAAVDFGLHRMDPPMRIEVLPDGGWRTFLLEPEGGESMYWSRPGANLTLFYLSLALLPAMLLATPVALLRRLRMLAVGALLLYLLHVVAGIGLVGTIRCLASDPDSTVCKWGKTVCNTYGQFATVVIWGLLTWDVWLPRLETAQQKSEP